MRKATKFALQRLSVALMFIMLTAQTAWAETKTITYTVGLENKEGGGYGISGSNGVNYHLCTYNRELSTLPKTITVSSTDVTLTITSSGNYSSVSHFSSGNYIGFSTYDYTIRFESTNYFISHIKISGSWSATINIDNNTKSCTGTWLYNGDTGLAQRFEVTLTDTKPTHYYDITYELNGGENNSSNPTQYEMATGVTSFYDATRTGYHFDGWFSNSGLTDAITSIPTNSTGAKTLYAGWTINQYTLSFNTNGGTPATIAAITQDYGTTITAPADPSRKGYTFAGWNPALPTTMPAASNTHTAQWDIVDYDINYTLNGGTVASANPATYNVETNTFTLNNPTRTGYIFNGWTGSNGTTPQTTVTITKGSTTGSLNYTANWTPISYSVAFNGNGSTSGSMDAQSFTYDVAKALTSNAFSRAFTVTYAYNGATSENSEATATATATFSGWAESANGEKVYDDGQSVSNLATENNATVNLFAKWTDGIVTLPTPAKTGYTFGGWYSDSGLNTSVGDGGASYTPSEDITIYAKWIVNKYTITFVTGTGGTAIAPITQDYDSDITPPANPTRDGCTFAGWDKAIPTKMPAEDMTITAQWTLITYNITYDLANGELPTGQSNPATYNVETNTFTLINPMRSGYTFRGWTGSNGTTPQTTVTIIQGSSTGTLTYTANWTEHQYAITFNLNGGAFAPGVTVPTGYSVTSEDIIIDEGLFRDGYSFDGWTGTDLDSPTFPITIPAGSTGNRSYTAQWTPEFYNIFYNLNGGTNAAGNPAYYYIYSPTFTINPPTREGYTFVGWTGWIYTTPQTTITIPTGTMSIMSLTAHWSKDYSSLWSEGAGTESDPYIISSTTDLDQLATMVNAGENFSATYFKLGCDIAYNPNVLTIDSDEDGIMDSNYKAIGYSDVHVDELTHNTVGNIRNFSGTFDGGGHTISGIRIGRGGNTLYDDFQGLFGWAAGGTIKNITLADADITGKKSVGGIVGFNAGVIENCHVKSDVFIRAAQNGASLHGGIAGSNGGTISHCTSAAILSIDASVDASTCNYYGGIAGDVQGILKNNLVIGATVPAVGVAEPAVGQYYGAIVGTDGEARYVNGELFINDFSHISNNYYANCTVGGVANATNVGLGYKYGNYDGNYDLLDAGTRTTDWTENDGAVSATILSESAAVPSTLSGKVVFRRTFKAGQPSTLCLPFSFVPDQTTQGKVYEFGGVNDQWRVQMNNIQRSDATAATVVNQPYGFIPVIPDGKQKGDEVVVIFSGTASGTTVAADHTQVGNWDMHGTYERVDWSSGYWYGYNAANGVFSHCVSGAYFPTFRCYLVFTPPSATRGNSSLGTTLPDQMGVDFNDSANALTTGVDSINVLTAQDAWYTLDGRKLDAEPTKKGIYIYKGKKVIK